MQYSGRVGHLFTQPASLPPHSVSLTQSRTLASLRQPRSKARMHKVPRLCCGFGRAVARSTTDVTCGPKAPCISNTPSIWPPDCGSTRERREVRTSQVSRRATMSGKVLLARAAGVRWESRAGRKDGCALWNRRKSTQPARKAGADVTWALPRPRPPC